MDLTVLRRTGQAHSRMDTYFLCGFGCNISQDRKDTAVEEEVLLVLESELHSHRILSAAY